MTLQIKITKKLIGKRVLISRLGSYLYLLEVVVMELSPSGDFVKLNNVEAGTTYWESIDKIDIKEVLDGLPVEGNK